MKKELLISKNKIKNRIFELTKQIENDFKDINELIIICVLKGAFIFTSDLVRNLKINCNINFISASSYGNRIESSGVVKLSDINIDILNKNVLIVEDILDTGLTLSYLINNLKNKNPKVLKTCVLLDKKEKRKIKFEADYVGFEIPDKFVIGYGLDYDEFFRELPEIYYIKKL